MKQLTCLHEVRQLERVKQTVIVPGVRTPYLLKQILVIDSTRCYFCGEKVQPVVRYLPRAGMR